MKPKYKFVFEWLGGKVTAYKTQAEIAENQEQIAFQQSPGTALYMQRSEFPHCRHYPGTGLQLGEIGKLNQRVIQYS